MLFCIASNASVMFAYGRWSDMLKDFVMQYGEPWSARLSDEFGDDLDGAERVCDFYANGGLEVRDDFVSWNYSLQYLAVIDGELIIGGFEWFDWESFDEDAEWRVMSEWELLPMHKTKIVEQIMKVYEKHC